MRFDTRAAFPVSAKLVESEFPLVKLRPASTSPAHKSRIRGCSIRTRNQRLAAVHAMARFIAERSPEHIAWCSQIRSVPFKRFTRRELSYIDKSEMDGLLAIPETIVPSPATSANALGLTTQVPVRAVYLTSGRTRKLTLGNQVIELQHAPSWQLTFAKEPAGEIVRALAWAGPERVQEVLKEIERKVPWSELEKVNQHISMFPIWMARALCQSDRYTATVKT